MPDWRELAEEVLSPDLAPELVAQLHVRHREIWLSFHYPDQVPDVLPIAPADIPAEQMAACRQAARKMIEQRDFATAGNTLKLLRSVLGQSEEVHLPPAQRLILSHCLTDLSICECEVGRHDAAIALAQEALRLLGSDQSPEELAPAIFRLASALHRGGYVAQAVEQAERGRLLLSRVKLTPEVLDLRRANADLLMTLGQLDIAEEDLVRQMVESEALPLKSRYPVLLSLSRIALSRTDPAKARYWLELAADFAQQGAETSAPNSQELLFSDRLELEQALDRLEHSMSA
jgi:tetratricopeptide (TPR) repeat protein